MWLSPQRRAHSSSNCARDSLIEGGSFSKCISRLSAAHTCFQNVQVLHGLRAVPFQNVALALAPSTFWKIARVCKSIKDSHDRRTRHGVLERFKIMRAQQLG
eukprot:8641690-Pyramimonas_sp.AAC.1